MPTEILCFFPITMNPKRVGVKGFLCPKLTEHAAPEMCRTDNFPVRVVFGLNCLVHRLHAHSR